jgi:hypothetical protein
VSIVPDLQKSFYGQTSYKTSARAFHEHVVLLDRISLCLAGVLAEQVSGQGAQAMLQPSVPMSKQVRCFACGSGDIVPNACTDLECLSGRRCFGCSAHYACG